MCYLSYKVAKIVQRIVRWIFGNALLAWFLCMDLSVNVDAIQDQFVLNPEHSLDHVEHFTCLCKLKFPLTAEKNRRASLMLVSTSYLQPHQ